MADVRDVFYVVNKSNPGIVDDPLFVSVLAGMFGWETEGLETGIRVIRNANGSISFVDKAGATIEKPSTEAEAGPSHFAGSLSDAAGADAPEVASFTAPPEEVPKVDAAPSSADAEASSNAQ
ncbi:hypothetical protein V5O48_009653 [Marasmius crinis-equi]|uniref:Uncharacterized protein n=1 Tax=Marasmius crinis-equi TaxID=585013 RepID=A0ABR3FB34_9AGAR